MKQIKTNALRMLDSQKISYTTQSYEAPDGFLDGVSVAKQVGLPVERVFKTLVTQGASGEHYVCVIPVGEELDLKKAAIHFKEKRIEMIHAKDITKITGYIKGGCSPVGMKKRFLTAIDQSGEPFERIMVSAGKVGLQMELSLSDLLAAVDGQLADLIKK